MHKIKQTGLRLLNSLLLTLLCVQPPARAEDLSHIYQIALTRDPQLRASRERRDAALAIKSQRLAQLLPQLNLSADKTWNHFVTKQSPIPGRSGTNEYFWSSFLNLELLQPVFRYDFWVQLSQADHQVAESEALYQAAQQNLIVRVAQAYFGILFARDNLFFNQQTRDAFQQQLEQAKRRFAAGFATITDVSEVQSAYDQARSDVIAAANTLDNAHEALREITGQYAGELSGLVKDFPYTAPTPRNIEAWTQTALRRNPNVIAAENRAQAAQKAIEVQFAGHLPQIDIVGNAGFTDSDRSTAVSTESQTIAFRLTLPLFAGGGVNAQVRQASHDYQAALENLDGQRRTVVRQVRNAYRGVLTTIGQIEALQAALDSAQTALEANREGFKVGARTMVDVLIAQRNLLRAQLDYSRTRYDYLINTLLLRQAAGSVNGGDIYAINRLLGMAQPPS